MSWQKWAAVAYIVVSVLLMLTKVGSTQRVTGGAAALSVALWSGVVYLIVVG